jgi:hypothetical protein
MKEYEEMLQSARFSMEMHRKKPSLWLKAMAFIVTKSLILITC